MLWPDIWVVFYNRILITGIWVGVVFGCPVFGWLLYKKKFASSLWTECTKWFKKVKIKSWNKKMWIQFYSFHVYPHISRHILEQHYITFAKSTTSYSSDLHFLGFQDRSEKGALICSKICSIVSIINRVLFVILVSNST